MTDHAQRPFRGVDAESIAKVIDPVAFDPISLRDTHPGWQFRREKAIETASKILALDTLASTGVEVPAQRPLDPISKYELAARWHGWVLKPNKNGGVFERCASDEPERVHLCGDWGELCKFADINVAAFIPPTEADLRALRKKVAEFILEADPFGDRFSRREIHLIEACAVTSTVRQDVEKTEDGAS